MTEIICLYDCARITESKPFVNTRISRIKEIIGVDRHSKKSAGSDPQNV